MSSLKQTTKPVSNAKSIQPADFINKCNTCYANSIFRILSVIPTLWNRVPLEQTLYHVPYELSVSTWLSTKPVDPSNSLWALKCKLSNIRGTPFDIKAQQDVAEILQVVLDELKGVSFAASHLIANTKKNNSFLLLFVCVRE